MADFVVPKGFEAVFAAMAFATVLVNIIVAWLRQVRPTSNSFPLLASVPAAALVLIGILFVGGDFSTRNAVAALLAAPFVAGGSTFLHETQKNAKPGLRGGVDIVGELPPLEPPRTGGGG